MELALDQALKKGIEAHKAGQLNEADRYYTAILNAHPEHPDANHNMGVLAVGVGKVQEALHFFKKAIDANPRVAQFWFSYIEVLIKLGQLSDAKSALNQAKSIGINHPAQNELIEKINETLMKAPTTKTHHTGNNSDPSEQQLKKLMELYNEGQFKKANLEILKLIEKFSTSIILYTILGATERNLGDLEKAAKAYRKAIEIKPDYAIAYYNLGNILNELNKPIDASIAYKKAIEIKPDYAIAYYNLGNILNELNKPIDASIAYRKAIEIKPDYAEAYNNLGAVLEYQDNPADAIDLYIKAINKKPDYIDPYINLGNVLNGVTFKKARPDLEPVILSLLNKNTAVNPRDICKSTLSALKHRKELNKYLSIESLSSEFFRSNQIIKDLVGIPLLLKLMGICPLPDIELENLLVFLRSTLLLSKDSIEFTKDLLKFQSALALQCFTNEYIYHTTNEEKKALLELEDEVIQILSTNQQPSSSSILCLTSYKPLYDYSWATSLIANDEIMDIYIQQLQDPEIDTHIKTTLPHHQKDSNSPP